MAGESASFDDHQHDANGSIMINIKNHEHGGENLSDKISGMFKSLKPLPDLDQSLCCIYKVSESIRKSNEEAYTPQVISIGPFHRNNPKVREMEEFKLRCLECFKDRTKIKLEDLVSIIKGAEKSVRECYINSDQTIQLGSDDFVDMILVDASFIIEFFWKKWSNTWSEYDRKKLTSWASSKMHLDLILLENQLPFFIIEQIYDLAFPSLSKEHPFIELTFCHFQDYNVQGFHPRDSSRSVKILHFTDLLRNFCLPRRQRRPKRNSEIIKEMRSATQLARVGLKFNKSSNCSPLELKYAANGVLEIPCFQLDKNTEVYARNLIAFEQCHYPEDAYITEYYFLLRLLIRGRKDLVFLARKEIVKWVDDIDAAPVLNKIFETIDCSLKNDDYSHLAEKTNKFYKARGTYLQIMKAKLKRDYFRNPWRGAATMGGILLLLFTFIQTVCALISLKNL